MEGYLRGNVLLVGEGDFSFAIALVQRLGVNKQLGKITATSLESEETISKHRNAVENMQELDKLGKIIVNLKGVEVRLNTDATQLHINPALSSCSFQSIIFNFPHAGGKSNHKKNRKLLEDFFASAVQVLNAEGQILVTLCKGQGGTPADQPMRAWHDSWQVVSMAANSDLILRAVKPFNSENYTTYSSTGFRSLDKGFHTENALTHVFETAPRVMIPEDLNDTFIQIGSDVYTCSRYLYGKLLDIRNANRNGDHPIHKAFCTLSEQLGKSLQAHHGTIQNLGLCQPITSAEIVELSINDTKPSGDSKLDDNIHSGGDPIIDNVQSRDSKSDDYIHSGGEQINDNIHSGVSKSNTSDTHTCGTCIQKQTGSDSWSMDLVNGYMVMKASDQDKHSLNLSEVMCFSDLAIIDLKATLPDELFLINHPLHYATKDTDCVSFGYGPVFRKCPISVNQSTVSYYMTLTLPIFGNLDLARSLGQGQSQFEKSVKTCVGCVTECLESIFEVKTNFIQQSDLCSEKSEQNLDSLKSGIELIGSLDISMTEADKSEQCSAGALETEIGDVYLLKTFGRVIESQTDKAKKDNAGLIVMINLNKLISFGCSLSDERLLWSSDSKIIDQFRTVLFKMSSESESRSKQNDLGNKESCSTVNYSNELNKGVVELDSDSKTVDTARSGGIYTNTKLSCADSKTANVVKAVSLYPMTFIHDMSFWENESQPFNEGCYYDVIRDVASDYVISVQLLDMYKDSGSGRTSRCYRLTFQSADKVLSYNTSWKLQSVIRLEVQKRLNITLR